MRKSSSIVWLVWSLLLFGTTASADQMTLSLDIKGHEYSGSIGSAPFGTVQLTLDGGAIDVLVTPVSRLHLGSESGLTAFFAFNYTGSGALNLSLPSYVAGYQTHKVFDVFGTFDYVLTTTHNNISSLSFTVSRTGGFTSVMSLVDLSTNPTNPWKGVDFAAQVINCYGFVGGVDPPVPEPGAIVLFGSGVVAAAFWIRRRRARG